MKHQLKEDIRDQYIYGILKDSGERIMPTLDELIKRDVFRITSMNDLLFGKRGEDSLELLSAASTARSSASSTSWHFDTCNFVRRPWEPSPFPSC